jgi:plastocyanin
MLRRVAVLAMAGVVLVPLPTSAATHSISVVSNAFQPSDRDVALGDTVEWTNDASVNHTTTGARPLVLWDENPLSPGETFPRTFRQAGRFGYFCDIHESMQGTIRVPVRVTPASGGLATVFTVRVATIAAPNGFHYVIQRRKGSGAWNPWRTVTGKTTSFDPTSPGRYSFRSKLERISDGQSSGYSPARSITVNG